jgi:hypothetical protein
MRAPAKSPTGPWVYVVVGLIPMLGLALYMSVESQPEAATPAPESAPVHVNAGTDVQVRQTAPHAAASAATSGPLAVRTSADVDPTEIFELGFGGGLVINRDLGDRLQAVAALLNEDPRHAVRYEAALKRNLPPADAAKAMGLLRSYQAYENETRQYMSQHGFTGSLEAIDAMYRYRQARLNHHFTADSARDLFGDQLTISRVRLMASVVEADSTLSSEQKAARLGDLYAQVPPAARDQVRVAPAAGGASAGTNTKPSPTSTQ